MVAGYSLAFGEGNAWIGDFSRFFLGGLAENWDKPFTLGSGDAAVATTIPESIFLTFQMTFAIITAALITGAVADRMKFSALLVFVGLWTLLVYAPVAHWVWHPNGWIFALGALDFAGGTVVHINAGVAGLVAAIVLGKRVGYGSENLSPYNLGFAVIGAALLWVGWFGFNAGSALGSSGGRAAMAMLVTQIAAAAAVLSWQGQAFRAGRDFRRGSGPGGHHPGCRLRAAGQRADHRPGGWCGGLLGCHGIEARAQI
jgi:Amt family ammonium transporter